MWTEGFTGTGHWQGSISQSAGLALLLVNPPSQPPQHVRGVETSSVVTMQPRLIRQPRIHFPSLLRGLHTAWERMREKASWLEDSYSWEQHSPAWQALAYTGSKGRHCRGRDFLLSTCVEPSQGPHHVPVVIILSLSLLLSLHVLSFAFFIFQSPLLLSCFLSCFRGIDMTFPFPKTFKGEQILCVAMQLFTY